jgi:hypothetical protein
MNGRRAVVSLCMLCALLGSAFAAQGASAATKGTTAFTCKKKTIEGGAGFSKEHCKPDDAVASGAKYEDAEVPQDTTTKVTANNTTTEKVRDPSILTSTFFGATIELKGEITEGEGWMTNAVEGKEHYAHGEGTITYTEVSVVKPAGCEVTTDVPGGSKGEKGVIHTEPLKATTKGQGDRVKFVPKEGTTFARFWLAGAGCPVDLTFTMTGSVLGTPNGATINFTEADTTAQNTLKFSGTKAGFLGTATLESKDEKAGDTTYEPLSVTTVETS